MKRDDVIDPTKWRQMLWRGVAALDDDEPAEPPVIVEAPAGRSEPSPRERALDAYAESIDLAWYERDPAVRVFWSVELTGKLLGGIDLRSLGVRHPRAAVRAMRLLIVAWPVIGPEKGRDRCASLALARLEHPEVGDLLVEAAALGDHRLAFGLERAIDSRDDLETLDPSLGRKLARLLETAATWSTRELALTWLSRGRWPEGVPWFRKALRWPHLRTRYVALGALLEGPGALTAEDVAWLVEDCVAHPLPGHTSRDRDVGWYYQGLLRDAVKRAPSEALRAPLERIIAGDAEHIEGDRFWLDRGWATGALASVDLARAVTLIDQSRIASLSTLRLNAAEACRELPDELARPRLLDLAADGWELVVRVASQEWTRRFGSPCPVDPLAGLAMHLLEGQPSESFHQRVAVFRGKDDQAREALLRVVMGEAPTREALVLTLFGRRVNPHLYAKGIPTDGGAWARWLRRRHGVVAFDAVLWEGENAPGGDELLSGLGLMARDGRLPKAYRAPLADAALRALRSRPAEDAGCVLYALRYAGPSWEGVELYWSLLLVANPGVVGEVVDVLTALGPDAALDRRTIAAYEDARAAGDWDRVERFGRVAIARRVAAVIAHIESDLWELDDPAADEALGTLYYQLRNAKMITDARVVEALVDPSLARFVRYATTVKTRGLRAESIARLRSALGGTARGGESAAVAMLALLRARVLRPGDRRVDEVIARAPARLQLSVLGLRDWFAQEARKGEQRRLNAKTKAVVESLLGSTDRAVVVACAEYLEPLHEGDEAWLRGVYRRLPSGEARKELGYVLGEPTEAELYWQEDDGAEEEES